MSDIAVRVEHLGKQYRIGGLQKRHTTMRDAIVDAFATPIRRMMHSETPNHNQELIWALKDVSFEVKQGEVVGIIGRNGAGKSTLLKILSSITQPTEGRVTLYGRVGSLLEVGTGFHTELTGRENIYLNGAILGMTRAEIDRKFDEIVAFAEVEKFIDTPVKHYSSGMYVRLAFAVAAHLEPEILIVDEVLSVGDWQFQEKCLGKMDQVAGEGRTVLFVSHNLGAVRRLCKSGIILEQGRLVTKGPIDNSIQAYLGGDDDLSDTYIAPSPKQYPYLKFARVSQYGTQGSRLSIDKPVTLKFEVEKQGKKNVVLGLIIRNSQGLWVHHSSNEFNPVTLTDGLSCRECEIPPYALAPGYYNLDVILHERNVEVFEKITSALHFKVEFTGLLSDRTNASDWNAVCGPGLLQWH